MSTGTVFLLVIVLALTSVAAALASTVTRRRAAQWQGGSEADRLARERGARRAKAELAARRRRVDRMGIKPLSGERRSGYERRWTAVQEEFIDDPPQAATAAAGLVTAVAAERGYDVADSGQLLADLSVYHGRYLDGYRRAAQTTERAASAATEELRQALLDHRALFQDLLTGPSASSLPDGRDRRAAGARRDAWRQVVPSPRKESRRREGDGVAAEPWR